MTAANVWGIPQLDHKMAIRPRVVKSSLRSVPLPVHRLSKFKTIRIKPPPGVAPMHPSLATGDSELPRSFAELRLHSKVVCSLSEMRLVQPTTIQMLAIPKILRGQNVLVGAETGSGKTLSYLAPLLSRIKEEEETKGVVARLRRPRALIVAPSRVLAQQILSVAKQMCHVVKLRTIGMIGGCKQRWVRDSLNCPVDIAIATPESLLRYRHREQVKLSDVRHLVIDEADTMFDASFLNSALSILRSVQGCRKEPPVAGQGAQVILVAATLSHELLSVARQHVLALKKVTSKDLHRVLPHVEQVFLAVEAQEKADRLLNILLKKGLKRTMVFCNTVPSCDWTAHHLKDKGLVAVKLHGNVPIQERNECLEQFRSGDCRILVCTDAASRGLDFPQVEYVINFDFPSSVVDYLHRAGRTGRAGSKRVCQVVSLMVHRRDVQTALKLKNAAQSKSRVLHSQLG